MRKFLSFILLLIKIIIRCFEHFEQPLRIGMSIKLLAKRLIVKIVNGLCFKLGAFIPQQKLW